MIGDASTSRALPSGPASTGQLCSLTHAATAGRAHSGGSALERNAPASRPSTVCAEINDDRSTSSRVLPRRRRWRR